MRERFGLSARRFAGFWGEVIAAEIERKFLLAAHKADLAALGIFSSSPDEMYRKMMEDFKRRQEERSA